MDERVRPARVWIKRLLAAAVLMAGLGMFLLPMPAGMSDNDLKRAFQDAMHGPVFAAFTFVGLGWIRRRGVSLGRAALIMGSVSVLVAAMVEGLQALPPAGRTASFADFVFGSCGAVGVLIWIAARRKPFKAPSRWIASACAAAIAGLPFLPVALEAAGPTQVSRHLPSLTGFDRLLLRRAWEPQEGAIVQTTRDGDHVSLHVVAPPAVYPGVAYEPGYGDWSDYGALRLRIRNPGEAFDLGIRIDDELWDQPHGNRYESSVRIESGENEIRISFDELLARSTGRLLDPSRIERMILYLNRNSITHEFYLENCFLE